VCCCLLAGTLCLLPLGGRVQAGGAAGLSCKPLHSPPQESVNQMNNSGERAVLAAEERQRQELY
jgi:hypothetical protein